MVGGVPTQGHLIDARLKALLPPLPVVYVRAVPVHASWDPTEVCVCAAAGWARAAIVRTP